MDDLAELWDLYYKEGTISKGEYEKRVAQLEEHYYGPNGILTTYSKLYNIGV
jgi:hypothetical protein